ncbi:MAG: glutaredoxin domain-containing protein [Clostridia bacterium]
MVKVYSQEFCPDCDSLKNILKEKGIEYEEYDVNKDFTARATMLLNDVDTTPALIIENEMISGSIEDITSKLYNKIL